MNNFSGIWYRMWAIAGTLLALSIVSMLFEKPWTKEFKIKKCKSELIGIAFAICLGLFYASRIAFPDISSYTGEFIDAHRESHNYSQYIPLLNDGYTFCNGEGKYEKLYLDARSKKKIFPYDAQSGRNDLQKGRMYTVYFDNYTKIITRIETVE